MHNTSVKSKNKNRPEMQKALTTYKDPSAKKFNEEEFQQLMKNFDEWDKKKKEKIEKLKKEKEEEELKLLKDPEINKEENLKFNTNPKNYNIIERLYDQDIKKRKDKKLILTKIYTPPFKPQIHIDKNVLNKALERSRNNNKFRLIKRYYHTDENTLDDEVYVEDSQDNDNDNEDEENEENEENEEKDDSEEESDIYNNMKRGNYSEGNKKNRKVKIIKNFITEEESYEEDEANKKDKNNNKNANKEKNNIIIEFRLRNLLFRKKKPVRRNKSKKKKKRVGFNLDD